MAEKQENSIRGNINDYFSNKIAEILEQIDQYKQESIYDKQLLQHVGERLQALYILIFNETPTEDKTKQRELIGKLKELRPQLFINKKISDGQGNIRLATIINEQHYYTYKSLLEKREINLNLILKKMGFFATKQNKKLF